MGSPEIVQDLIDQITELPSDAQAELMCTLAEMRSLALGIGEREDSDARFQ